MKGKPIYTKHKKIVAHGENAAFKSIGIIPIKHEDKVIACLNIASKNLNEIPNDISYSLETISSHIASFIKKIKSNDELRKSEERFRSLVENSPDFIYIADSDGTVRFINRTIPPTTKENIIGKNIIDFTLPEDKDIAKKTISKMLKTKFKQQIETRSSVNNDIVSYYENRFIPLIRDGEVEKFIGVSTDITERKQAEEKLDEAFMLLQKMNDTLEKKVKERTFEIRNLITQKEEFICNLSHDLKTPLTPLLNLLPLLANSDTEPENKKMFDLLIRNVKVLKNLVEKTIIYEQLNSINVEIQLDNTNLCYKVNEISDNNKNLIDKKNIQVVNQIDKGIIVKADTYHLNCVFNNLFNNSVKYNLKERKIITINAYLKEDEILVSFKDNGMGMTKEQINHVFDEFYKVDGSRHDLNASGLGLSICKRIIELHDGKIWVESEGLSKGCTFYFTLKAIK